MEFSLFPFLTALALVLSSQSAGTPKVGGWEIFNAAGSCIAEKVFDDGTTLGVSIGISGGRGDITIWHKKWYGISESIPHPVQVKVDDLPPITIMADGMLSETSGGFYIPLQGYDLIGKVLAAKKVSFTKGAEPLGTYALNGPNMPMETVARCAAHRLSKILEAREAP